MIPPSFSSKRQLVAALGISLPIVRLRGLEGELRNLVLELASRASGQDFDEDSR